MFKRILTASIVLLFAGFLVIISANELTSSLTEKTPEKTTIFLSK